MKKITLLFVIATLLFACEQKNIGENPNNNNDSIKNPTTEILAPEGAINAIFSIGTDKTVYFSKGNLQYQASTNTWRFAEKQYTLAGKENENISATYDGWIDLFGWGTSGYNNKQPYLYDAPHTDFGDGMNSIAGTNYDWGIYNKIANGGNQIGIWRTLSADEWGYLLFDRHNAAELVGAGSIDGQNGLFILPDNWIPSNEPAFTSFADKGATNDGDYWYYGISNAFTHNKYSIEQFEILESKGVVFLPSSVLRTGTTLMTGMGTKMIDGYYWTTTPFDTEKAYIIYFFGNGLRSKTENFRSNGFSVRLIQDIK
jgi:hypothetical protein